MSFCRESGASPLLPRRASPSTTWQLAAEITHDRHEAQVRSSYRGLAIVKGQTDPVQIVAKGNTPQAHLLHLV